MALTIHWISDLDAVLEPALRWLEQRPPGAGLFDTDKVVVPTEGTKAWLSAELAVRNGARGGFPDGVVAQVEFVYPGALRRLLLPSSDRRNDPWSVDRLTTAVLAFLPDFPELDARSHRVGGPLVLARRIADRFDHYHTRRPEMIRRWAMGKPLLTPCAADSPAGPQSIPESDRWQFELWRLVRDTIGVPSPPETVQKALETLQSGNADFPTLLPSRLLVAGLQSLSASSLEILDALSTVSDIEAYLVHPSPALGGRWAADLGPFSGTKGLLPVRVSGVGSDPRFDPLPSAWLQGSRELQALLHAFRVRPEPEFGQRPLAGETVLHRVQSAVRDAVACSKSPRSSDDQSLRIHRCHSLSRQVEVLHDALLHAFREIPSLQPHEVVIVSPRIEEAAPLLEAVFDRDVAVAGDRTVRLPLVVADRSLRRVSDGASFLADVLDTLLGRCDIDTLGKVAGSPLVLKEAGVGSDVVSVWDRLTERTRVGWGLDPVHRAAHGLDARDIVAHTWWQALERSLLGALLPDSEPETELGDVVPLTDLDPEELPAVAALVRIVSVLADLEAGTRDGSTPALRPIPDWCDHLTVALRSLCGMECDAIRPALDVLDGFRAASLPLPGHETNAPLSPVAFAEFATLLEEKLEGNPGRTPLRTGAITATSLVPLRGVPFRVVCLLGMDDGTFGAGESGGDDLAGLQKLAGDRDVRIDSRRQFLDAVLSARERVIITCDGRSIVNNQPVPLTTALAEFVDFVERVAPQAEGKEAPLELQHPRHAVSTGNFRSGTLVSGWAWSHDTRARGLCRVVGKPLPERSVSDDTLSRDISPVVELAAWDRLVRNPLDVLAKDILRLHLYEERADPDRGLLPLTLPNRQRRKLIESVFPESSSEERKHWIEIARRLGELPVGACADRAARELDETVDAMQGLCAQWDLGIQAPPLFALQWTFDGGRQLVGAIPGVVAGADWVRAVDFQFADAEGERSVGLHLLVLAAIGNPLRAAVRVQPERRFKEGITARLLFLDEDIDADDAEERLEILDTLYRRASVRPYAFFGDTVKKIFADPDEPDREAGRQVFSDFLNDSYNAWRSEVRLFGPQADFDTFFDDDAMEFWGDFQRVMRIDKAPGGRWRGRKAPLGRRMLS